MKYNEPLGVKCKTCVKFVGRYITYDVQILEEKSFKQRLKRIKNTINLWKSRGLSINGKVNIIKTLLFPKMICPSSVICTPYEVIKELNSLIFRFLWNGNDKVIRPNRLTGKFLPFVVSYISHFICSYNLNYNFRPLRGPSIILIFTILK